MNALLNALTFILTSPNVVKEVIKKRSGYELAKKLRNNLSAT
jgi:hypothetical protein